VIDIDHEPVPQAGLTQKLVATYGDDEQMYGARWLAEASARLLHSILEVSQGEGCSRSTECLSINRKPV
jgi:hypothetical protein